MDAEIPLGVDVQVRNRHGWKVVLPLGSTPEQFHQSSFYLDFAGNLILQHRIMGTRQVYARPYHIVRPGPTGWIVEHKT